MSQQVLDVRGSLRIVRRYWGVTAAATVLGLFAGVAFGLLAPPPATSSADVVLPGGIHDISTQVVLVTSDSVLEAASRSLGGGLPAGELRTLVQAKNVAATAITITAHSPSAAQARRIANAVAESYVSYLLSGKAPDGPLAARLTVRATSTIGTSATRYAAETGLLGGLAGALAGAVIALAIGRGDRRLRERDEIAESIGVPVLASVRAGHPSSTAGWAKLVRNYQPEAPAAQQLHVILTALAVTAAGQRGPRGGGRSLSLLSLAADRRALALGPQLAAFAALQGIRTALVIGPPPDARATAMLRAACAGAPERSAGLWFGPGDHDGSAAPPDTELTIVVGVVDRQDPQVAGTGRADVTLLGISPGQATAAHLARVAASAAADGRRIAGIVVADPDPDDKTTGRLPRLTRVQRRGPARTAGTPMESSR